MDMIQSKQLAGVLTKRFPDTNRYNCDTEELILGFAIYTCRQAQQCNVSHLKDCLDTVDDLYQHGDEEIKHIIERVYVPVLKNRMERQCAGGKLLKIYLPYSLYHIYISLCYKH
ncbi:DUF7674 family protein [Deminuibacter soli]|uniref:DUF7674 domain-containing protein n=1 Tax=Deminuibacter soli TaxID=2291815 RepID=A0A3E1NEU8_9BACT|nr:hypothetical protein [Deminuibacter soli]RFM26503.1 hypothetical protein DXN05_19990 [Deminuibacter soli]